MSSLNARSRLRHGSQGQTTLENMFGEEPGQSISHGNPIGGWREHNVDMLRAGEKVQIFAFNNTCTVR